ncbi:MAG: DNA polymerase III subunit delta' [Burkholderiales bacterium]|nr:DNA polymerase III subunit delta' [Burkholderiales bacterium]
MTIWFKNELEAMLAQKARLAHALLIKGPRGIGKQAFSMELARALLCESLAADGAACGQCKACNWFTSGAHPDFRVLAPIAEGDAEAESEEGGKKTKPSPWISIEQVRELHDFVYVSSHRGGRKVILVCPAEALNVNAANALLKSLEEPPALMHFILISHRPHRLPRTIISRCRQLSLRQPDRATALAWLGGQGVADPEVALAQSSGAPLLALAASEGDELAGRRDFLSRIAPPDFDPLAIAETFRDLPLERFIAWLQKWTYDIAELRMLDTIRFNPDLARELAIIAKRVEPLAALRLHRKLVREQRNIHHPLNARLYIESVLLAYAAVVNPSRKAA